MNDSGLGDGLLVSEERIQQGHVRVVEPVCLFLRAGFYKTEVK